MPDTIVFAKLLAPAPAPAPSNIYPSSTIYPATLSTKEKVDITSLITLIAILLICIFTSIYLYFVHDSGMTAITFCIMLIVSCVLIKHSVDLDLSKRHLNDYDDMFTYDTIHELVALQDLKAQLATKMSSKGST